MKYYVGIDIGSVSTNVIAIDEDYNLIFDQYIRANGQPLESVKKGMQLMHEKLGCNDDDILVSAQQEAAESSQEFLLEQMLLKTK